ncbi:venom allergen 5-like isoform X1 [Musca domestica]|uniref:Venom allergen 5-like isoform X1 n=2 Tax=Musca domestica TaxID=7370 RepID=A0ABM3VBS1_MUSDO|nr:venom allergen 5-like isoform X1 [Musca domestica]
MLNAIILIDLLNLSIGSIFSVNYCEMDCRGEPHTLCSTNHSHASCLPTSPAVSEAQRREMKNMLIMGHNGIRNRIADRMMVANMVEMVWHEELAAMAQIYLAMCKPFTTDPCANLTHHYDHNDDHAHHTHFSGSTRTTYRDVAQSRYLQRSIHYPNLLIENALRAWYLERDSMMAPTFNFNSLLQSEVGHIVGENNFTHLASPLTSHFGCAFDKLFEGYLLICNYHPYRRRVNSRVDFFHGKPGSLCPISSPLRNTRGSLTSLCIGIERNTGSTTPCGLFAAMVRLFLSFLLVIFQLY